MGLPVFNGENFLADAIGSVLGQSFPDFELVISDNASTDRTEEICRDFASRDARVRYFRNERNLGAAANYNRAWAESRGRYFKWLAHDDRIRPDYLAAMVGLLDARPDVVLCNSVVDYIDARGETFATYDSVLGDADCAAPSDRFAAMVLRSHSCVDFFGTIRRSAMEGSLLHGHFHGADRAFLAQMALRGRLAQTPEPLVEMREHDNRYTRRQHDAASRQVWHDPSRRLTMPTLTLYREYRAMLTREDLPAAEKRRCARVLRHWWFTNWNAVRVGVDLGSHVFPGLTQVAERTKTRIFGRAPGHFTSGDDARAQESSRS